MRMVGDGGVGGGGGGAACYIQRRLNLSLV